jgi:hypothetical protein
MASFSTTLPILIFCFAMMPADFAVQLHPETDAAFNHYIQLTEQRMDKDLREGRFLVLGRTPQTTITTQEFRTLDNGKEVTVPHGQIHHWTGAVFLPGVTLATVRALKQDYDNYKNIYKPDVIDSKLIKRDGDEFEVFLKLAKKQILSVAYNTNYRVRYYSPDPKRFYLRSYSTRIAELQDPSNPNSAEKAAGEDHGFLWRLNSYWRLEEADNGVYVECEAISLSRDVPHFVQYIVGSFIKKFPAESMRSTLTALKHGAETRTQATMR